MKISGIFAPLTTPFVKGEVSLEYLKANLRKYSRTPLAGFFVLGSNGESKSLTEKEKLNILEVVLQEKGERQKVMAGAGYESTGQTIAFSRKTAEMGADFVSILTPSYFKKQLTDEALIRYYSDIADAVSVPVLAYNAPGFTGVTLSVKIVQAISRHPNIAGMKDTSPGNMSAYLDAGGNAFDILSGTAGTLFEALCLGASGGVVSLANAFPLPCCELYEKCTAGDLEQARKWHFTLFRLNRCVSGSFGVAGVKYAMELSGFYGGDPRLPLLPLNEKDKAFIKDAVTQAGAENFSDREFDAQNNFAMQEKE